MLSLNSAFIVYSLVLTLYFYKKAINGYKNALKSAKCKYESINLYDKM